MGKDLHDGAGVSSPEASLERPFRAVVAMKLSEELSM